MIKNFFAYEPKNVKSSYFSIEHILFIVVGIFLCFVVSFLLRKVKRDSIRKILKVLTFVALLFDPMYWIWEMSVSGQIHWNTSLPCYFCSLFYFVLPFAAFCKNKKVEEIALAYLATMNLLAGTMGLVFNTHLATYSFYSFVGLRTLFYHLLMIFVSIMLWVTGYYKPKIKDTYRFIIPMAILFLPALIANLSLKNADYCFMMGGEGTPFEILSKNMPLGIYIPLLYIAIFILINISFYGITIFKFTRQKVKQSKENKNLQSGILEDEILMCNDVQEDETFESVYDDNISDKD